MPAGAERAVDIQAAGPGLQQAQNFGKEHRNVFVHLNDGSPQSELAPAII